MFFLLSGDKKKAKKEDSTTIKVKELFLAGKFPVVTTDQVEGKVVSKMLGLVCCRGYDSDEAFFGMASRAVNKGAHAIVGYKENVAFHPDGSKYFSCYGTAVMFDWDPEERYGAAALLLDNLAPVDALQDQIRDQILRSADYPSPAENSINLQPGMRVNQAPDQKK